MSVLHDDIEAQISKILRTKWEERDGQKVPTAEEVQLGNHAVKLDGTVLYADLSDSTAMVNDYKNWFAAEIYKSFLYSAARLIRARGGVITAYDGDRVMGVFIGDSKNTSAVKCGLQINYVVTKMLQPAIAGRYPKSPYEPLHVVGIDTSSLYVARTGVRGDNDLVWVGRAANYAAKMAALDNTSATYISASVYNNMNESSKLGGDPKKNMWKAQAKSKLGLGIDYYGSTWHWKP